MKILSPLSVAAGVLLLVTGPLEAQSRSDRDEPRVEREERRGSGLARFAARALGASEEEAEAAALLLPAVQQLRASGRRDGGAERAAGDLDGDGVVGLADCELALRNPEGLDQAAFDYLLEIERIKGESGEDLGGCGEQLGLLLPAVQKIRD